MNQGHTGSGRDMKPGNDGRIPVRSTEDPAGVDDLGLPADARPDGTRAASEVRPDPERTQANDNEPVRTGTVPLEENQQHPSDPLKPGEADEYGTRLEKLIAYIEPPGHEVKDDDIFDPGHMTPGAPPVDNRS
ncbi:MAG TPA: hypothetical protein VM406_04385 [Noviherbaspirillum sp.]|nr:hypothetical protein [Noviherbaspirillum sp.]